MGEPSNYSTFSGIDTRGILVCSDDLDKLKTSVMSLFAIVIFLCFLALPSIHNSGLFERGLFIFVIAGLLFFIGLTLYRVYFKRRSVVISPEGIEDSGITTEKVPWTAVDAVELKTVPRALTSQQPLAVLLRLKPHAGEILKLTRRGRMLFLNSNALWIPVGRGMIVDGYQQSPERFLRTIEAYAQTYGKGVS